VIPEPARVLDQGRRGSRRACALLAAPLAVLFLGLLSREGSSEGDPPGPPARPDLARLCGRRHPGGGESSSLDLGAVRKAYRDLEGQLGKSFERKGPESALSLDRPYDAGLPACRSGSVRTRVLASGEASQLRGRVLYFTEIPGAGRPLELPGEIAKNRGAEILVLRARSLESLPKIAETLGRPVSLAGAEFARALGVRCTNTWVQVSEKGDELELHEGR
jgi:hypothetical protein